MPAADATIEAGDGFRGPSVPTVLPGIHRARLALGSLAFLALTIGIFWYQVVTFDGLAGWCDGDYAAMARAAGLRVVLDRDITANTLPTYPVLTGLLRSPETPSEAGRRMLWPTRLLEWLSRLGFVRYRVVAFEK